MGEKLTQTNANGTRATYEYLGNYKLLKIINVKSDSSIISSFEYTYDTSGNILTKINQDSYAERYYYDSLSQLVKVEYGDSKIVEYEYDKVGNRLRMVTAEGAENAETTAYNYNSDNQLLYYTVNGTDTIIFEYDNNGNQICETDIIKNCVKRNFWDYDDRLTSISDTLSNTIVSYQYGSDWRRLKKTIGDTVTKYFYAIDDVITEYDQNFEFQNLLYALKICKTVIDEVIYYSLKCKLQAEQDWILNNK